MRNAVTHTARNAVTHGVSNGVQNASCNGRRTSREDVKTKALNPNPLQDVSVVTRARSLVGEGMMIGGTRG